MTYTVHHADALVALRMMADDSIDAIVTDPPYGLAFMGKHWDYDVPSVDIWREALRVLKPGGHLLAFGGTRTYHRMVVAIEDAGFEIRDQIQWIYGSGFPKSLDVSKAIDAAAGAEREVVGEYSDNGRKVPKHQNTHATWNGNAMVSITAPATPDAERWQGFGTALKPANEPICLARKGLTGTVAANVLAWGTGALNVDGCRVEHEEPTGAPSAGFHGKRAGIMGETVMRYRENTGPHSSGRWPANVIHDGSEEVTALFPVTTSKGHTPKQRGRGGLSTNGHKGQQDVVEAWTDTGSAARFFYTAKASKRERDAGLDGLPVRKVETMNGYTHPSEGRQADKNGGPKANHHPTVKPIALMRYLCRLITPPGGTVLDPFCGSGSTGCGAVLEGFNFVGIEREAEYVEIARLRIGHWIAEQAFGLFEMAAD